jgi:hypothetical protein
MSIQNDHRISGDLAGARPLHERALAISEKVLGVFLEHLYFDGNRDRVGYEQIDAPQALVEATRNLFN